MPNAHRLPRRIDWLGLGGARSMPASPRWGDAPDRFGRVQSYSRMLQHFFGRGGKTP